MSRVIKSNRISYFTAHIARRPDDPQRHNRQRYYLRALETIPHLHVHLGRFQESITRMRLANPPAQGPCTVKVIKTEEKGSDVNLATYLLADAFRGDFETALVITNDADLAEPIRLVCHELGLPVGVANPHPPYKRSIALERTAPTYFRQIRQSALRASQFPDTVRDGKGLLRRPTKW